MDIKVSDNPLESMTVEEAFAWVENHKHYLNSSQMWRGDDLKLFTSAYNAIMNENKKVTGCGRCIHNMKQALSYQLNKRLQDMRKFPVYKTTKGNFSFKANGPAVMWIHALNETAAKEQLKALNAQVKKDSE